MTILHESPTAKTSAPSNALLSPPPYVESESAETSQLLHPGVTHNFGPTPITTQALTPYAYYDAHSPYSLAQADTRARWRFAVGLLWALGLWIAVGGLVGVRLAAHHHGWRHYDRGS